MAGMLPAQECDPLLTEDQITGVRVYEVVGNDTTLFYQWDCSLAPGSYFSFNIITTGRHLLAMKAVDEAGNESCEFSQWTWRESRKSTPEFPVVGVPTEPGLEERTKTFDVMGRRTEIGSSQVYFKKKTKKKTILR